MLYQQTSRALLRTARRLPIATSSRTLNTSAAIRAGSSTDNKTPPSPTHSSRTGPQAAGAPDHPGYVPAGTPPSSKDPVDMESVSSQARPASMHDNASTNAGPPHPGTHEMASGGKKHGSDAITPEDRSQKNWGPNNRPQQFNKHEGKRNPVHHGGSNEGGFDKKGKSKT